ncbi:TPA: hypothetical protein VGS91_001974 [Citrobacter freundii]|nr:hypothetical protein [Citrobacter freundii]
MKPTYEELEIRLANAESKCRELAAENVVKHEFIKTCFRASADGASMDGDDIQKLGERLGLFGRETYQPVLHGYICGHEAGEDNVYVMKKTPKTDAFLAEVRAQGVEMFAFQQSQIAAEQEQAGDYEFSRHCSISATEACEFAEELREGKCCEVQS